MSEAHAMLLSLMVEKNDDGYLASIPGMQGAFAEGETMEEAVFNCVDVAKLIAAYRQERGEDLGLNRIVISIENISKSHQPDDFSDVRLASI